VLDLSGAPPAPAAVAATTAAPAGLLPAPDDWQRDHDAALLAASTPLATSATRLAADEAAKRAAAAAADPGLAKGAKDIDLPPWQRGRYGTAIGRAVHGVMQVVDLAPPYAGLAEAVRAQAAAEGVLGKEDVIEALCRSALASEVVQRAAVRPHWREVYVGVPYGEGVLEGYIDLLYRDDQGLVIVDYKTDAWSTQGELDTKVERYAVQLDAYAAAIVTSTTEAVQDCMLLFCGPTVAVSRSVRTTNENPKDTAR